MVHDYAIESSASPKSFLGVLRVFVVNFSLFKAWYFSTVQFIITTDLGCRDRGAIRQEYFGGDDPSR